MNALDKNEEEEGKKYNSEKLESLNEKLKEVVKEVLELEDYEKINKQLHDFEIEVKLIDDNLLEKNEEKVFKELNEKLNFLNKFYQCLKHLKLEEDEILFEKIKKNLSLI